MKHILLVGPQPYNSTDGVILAGIQRLLKRFFGRYSHDFLVINDIAEMSHYALKSSTQYDALFVCGTPWLWDSFQKSIKYKNLLRCFEIHQTKKVFMGIGSCLNLKDMDSNILEREEEQKGMMDLFKDALIFTRDALSQQKLAKAGINSKHLPCPSYFCYEDIDSVNHQNVLIWCDPRQTISGADWLASSRLDKYCEIVRDFYLKYHPEVYTVNPCEIPLAEQIGLPIPKLLYSVDHTLDVMREANYVLSGRVHCAVPAFVKGKALGLMPLDSRHLTLSDFGGLMIHSVEDLDKMAHEKRDFSCYLDEYADIKYL